MMLLAGFVLGCQAGNNADLRAPFSGCRSRDTALLEQKEALGCRVPRPFVNCCVALELEMALF